MNAEEEYVKASLGLPFTCPVCGRRHDPNKNGWVGCERKVIKDLNKKDEDLFATRHRCKHLLEDESIFRDLKFLNGKEIRDYVNRFYDFDYHLRHLLGLEGVYTHYVLTHSERNHRLKILILSEEIKRSALRLVLWARASYRALADQVYRCKPKPKAPRVEKIETTENDIQMPRITRVTIDGRTYRADTIIRAFAGTWSRKHEGFSASFELLQISDDVSYIVVRRIDTEVNFTWRRYPTVSKRYYLVSREGKSFQIDWRTAREKIDKLVEKFRKVLS